MSTDLERPVERPVTVSADRKPRTGLYLFGAAWIACWGLVLAQLIGR